MSESIQLNHLSDIKNVQWYFEDGGRIRRKDGTYKGVDYYPVYLYDARVNPTISIANKPLQWIHFRMISPRTRAHKDKIGMIQISYKFESFQSYAVFTNWCYEWELYDWLEQHITSSFIHKSSPSIEIPMHRRNIQLLNERQREEELENQYENQGDYYNDEYDEHNRFYHYRDYTWKDMIDDAFEGDESNYWNID